MVVPAVSRSLPVWLVSLFLLIPGLADGQGVRGELRALFSTLEYRGVVRDTIPGDQVPGDGITRVLPDGTVVTCVPGGDCYRYRAGDEASAATLIQDLRVTAWPGMRGVSAAVHLRGRLGSDDFWPRSSREIEVLDGHVDFQRERFRLRAGRQHHAGGLGAYPFDGGAFRWTGFRPFRVEAFVGRSLARTVLEPLTGSLVEEADNLPPDKGSLLWGVEGGARAKNLSGTLLYQRELRTDRASLYSERMAFDGRWTGPLTADLSADFDVAAGTFTEARLRLGRQLRPQLFVSAQARRYRPFFELWTIWGAFSPVGYGEGKVSASWTPRSELTIDAGAAYRNYEETHTGIVAAPIEGDGWRPTLGAVWTHGPWTLTGNAGAHVGYGAFRNRLDLTAGRRFGEREFLGLFASGTQQFSEFRFGDGRSRGIGVATRAGLGKFDLDGDVGFYRHEYENRPGFDDFSQVRARLGVTVGFGAEPGKRPLETVPVPENSGGSGR